MTLSSKEPGRSGIAATEWYIPAQDEGIRLYLRNKRPEGARAFGPQRTVLMVHGSSYPAHTAFDLPLGGMSWMDFIAGRGFDVYCLDLRGFGRSTRPPAMAAAPAAAAPIVDTRTALRDVAAAVAHICSVNAVPRLCLIGWSWGATLAGAFAAEQADQVERLALYAPQWLRDKMPCPDVPLGAYRTITVREARRRWLAGVPAERHEDLLPKGWFEAWAEATFATDPVGAAQDPPCIRAPNGNIADSLKYWCAGKPLYDPGRITAPTLVVVGDWDADTPVSMADQVFRALVASPRRRLVVIGNATHTVLLERNRTQLFDQIQLFLEESCAS